MDDVVEFVIFDQSDGFKRRLVALESTAEIPANGVPWAEFTLDDDHEALPAISVEGARCAYRFRGVEWFRGRVATMQGTGPVGQTTVRVEGDFRKLWDWQGWPKPTAAVTGQDVDYARYTGTSEDVFKAALAANFTRLGVPWTVAPSQGRGSAARAEFRFHPLAEKTLPALDADDLIVTITYSPDPVVDVRAAVVVPGLLSDLTGVLENYDWSRTAPATTRVVVGGEGEKENRRLYQKIDAALEASWGDIVETFKDSRMSDEGADLSIDADETLAEGAPTASVSMSLLESERFRFGSTFLAGDRVRVVVGPLDVTERITLVKVTESPGEGVLVTPVLGSVDDSPDAEIGVQVAGLARGLRDAGRR
ncbi:Gp37-like protein [Microbacterium soli]|uniref:Gp28/Gp37-like domain-containing protein n=1 Tax=Microbacterium soli TaxID=446075 RepID=A0ABP7NJX2_9MICO